MSSTYRAVDDGPDPAEARDWQERVGRWPQIRAYKEHTHSQLAVDGLILDVGCGPGVDLRALGPDRTVGVDPSLVMCRRAAEHGAVVGRASAAALPFPDGRFAGCRIDRVLQHLDAPRDALRELVRVLRPGGRLVAADPDQATLVIHVPGVPVELLRKVERLRGDVGYRNGRVASSTAALLAELGLEDIEVAGFPLVLRDPADAFGVAGWPRGWHARGVGGWTEDELRAWDLGLARARAEGGFLYALLYLVTSGTTAVPSGRRPR